jgi:hypothetical protein
MRQSAITLVAFCCLAAAASAEEATSIAWQAKPGQTASYRVETRNTGSPVAWVFSAMWKTKVLEVASDGKIKVQNAQSEARLTVDGQELAGAVDEANTTLEATYLPSGLPVQPAGGPRARLVAALQFVYPDRPVKPGDTWKQTFKADAARGLRSAEATYKYEGIETVGKWKAHKVTVTYRETEGDEPISVRGTEWLSVEDGRSVQSRHTVQNGPFAPGQPPEEAEVTGTRLD